MAKRKDSETSKQPKPAYAWIGALLGGAQIAIGVFIMWAMSTQRIAAPPWVRTAGMVLVVIGVITWFLSGLPRDQAVEWIKSGLFALGLALLIRWPIAEPYRIPSGSMEPTLHGDERIGRGDRVFVNKWIYGVRFPFMNRRIWYGADPQRWDIVVFKTVEKNALHKTLVKRIVGLPGERIHIANGKIHVNGRPVEPPPSMPKDIYYTSPIRRDMTGMVYGVLPEDEFSVVPKGHYLVMGDNSANSRDGRYFGWLPNENIVGRVACIWWPPTRWRDFTGFSQTRWWRTTVAILGIFFVWRLLFGRSWVVPSADGKRAEHLYISFTAFGLRLPFTPWWIVQWSGPKRGALVLYRAQGEATPPGAMLVGRIAALPTEKVAIENGKLTIEGLSAEIPPVLAEANYASTHPDAVYGRSRSKQHMHVPENHYFILADSPAPSDDGDGALDSRILGWVPRRALLGTALMVWWPPTRVRRI